MGGRFKAIGTNKLFAEADRLSKLSEQGDPLERLNKVVDWSYFRDTAEKAVRAKFVNAGPKPYDPLMMFKILILQRYYNLSDSQLEFQILDRLTFCRFLGLSLSDKVPDEKTVWLFRSVLIDKGLDKELFEMFGALLEEHGLIAHEGKLVDASFVEAPKQRKTRDENKRIKGGETPEEWDENPHKKRQKDTDARWTKKNEEKHFGYKNHAKIDNKRKFIVKEVTTDASVHDSQAWEDLIDEKDRNQDLWADSAYTGEKQVALLKKYGVINKVHEKEYKNKPLNNQQKEANTEKSKTRARVEHVFGFMEQSMNKLEVRSIGIKRAKDFVNMVNLTYNLFRYDQVVGIEGIAMS